MRDLNLPSLPPLRSADADKRLPTRDPVWRRCPKGQPDSASPRGQHSGREPGTPAAAPQLGATFFRGFAWALVFEGCGFAALIALAIWGPGLLAVLL